MSTHPPLSTGAFMRQTKTLLIATAAAVAAITTVGVVAATATTANATNGTPLPAHVFAPYFEAFNGDSLSGIEQQSGNKFMTLAFLQTASTGSCTVDWNGDTSMPVSNSTFG